MFYPRGVAHALKLPRLFVERAGSSVARSFYAHRIQAHPAKRSLTTAGILHAPSSAATRLDPDTRNCHGHRDRAALGFTDSARANRPCQRRSFESSPGESTAAAAFWRSGDSLVNGRSSHRRSLNRTPNGLTPTAEHLLQITFFSSSGRPAGATARPRFAGVPTGEPPEAGRPTRRDRRETGLSRIARTAWAANPRG